MPDYLLEKQDTHLSFMRLAEDFGMHYMLVWDMPTYLDDKEKSLEKYIVLIDSKTVFVPRRGQEVVNVNVGHLEYLKIDISSTANITIAIVLHYNNQEIRSYQEKVVASGSFCLSSAARKRVYICDKHVPSRCSSSNLSYTQLLRGIS